MHYAFPRTAMGCRLQRSKVQTAGTWGALAWQAPKNRHNLCTKEEDAKPADKTVLVAT